MRFFVVAFILLASNLASAEQLFFRGELASGTEKMEKIKETEFVFDSQATKLRLCGIWTFADGSTGRYEMDWALEGSDILFNGKRVGTYYGGNLMTEQEIEGQKGMYLSLEVSRSGPTWFEYHFHDPRYGFVDTDGNVQKQASEQLKKACL